ncbi:MAG TPA: excinuclease ABC subunit UvrA [Euzebyales bacterium]|nr:excinuclease ABC subunit UvrA [Euzebyales bacterium]
MTSTQTVRPARDHDHIRVAGARANNLANVTVEIPRGRLVVVTGVSGSGKSSLAFDTIAAESQRQLNETFPAFVRNRLPHRGQPDADTFENLTPVVVVDQRRLGGNARSTVGTATEIGTLLRLLYARAGTPFVGYSPAFSFNDPAGMCPACQGLGHVTEIDVDRLIDRDRSLDEGAIRFPTFAPGTVRWRRYRDAGFFDTGKPLRDYSDDEWWTLLHADGITPPDPRPGWPRTSAYEGVLPRLRRTYLARDADTYTEEVAARIEQIATRGPCRACGGARLNPTALRVKIHDRTIADCAAMEAGDLIDVVSAIDDPTVAPVVSAIADRLRALASVGLGYLTLDRETPTLSGGESQRVKLVRHLGSSLTGMTYVLDEPSAGLHAHDVDRLVDLLRRLRDKGSTVIVVEHDPDVIAVADHVIDMGPGGGADGGRVLYAGDVEGLVAAATPTGGALRRRPVLDAPARAPRGTLTFEHLARHNLRDITVDIPLGVLTVITGVAGSGKSTVVAEIRRRVGPDVVTIDQSPIHGSRRSTPATYTGVLDRIRALFARANGVPAGLFSANSTGACPECRGLGVIHTDLAFLDTVTTVCEACGGSRFNAEALAHRLDGRTISQVLGLTVSAALDVLTDEAILAALRRLAAVGLGYLTLDQPLSTLSGGERQRLALAAELERPGRTYLLDEPTAGLHPCDVSRLLGVLDRLVDEGGSVVVVEHDLEVISHADWVIDLGPGPGREGGTVLFAGTPADLVDDPRSLTAHHLRRSLRRHVGQVRG